jgi:hypothetical protein
MDDQINTMSNDARQSLLIAQYRAEQEALS